MPLTTEKAREYGKKSSRKGIPNKTTTEIREVFQLLLENNLEQLQADLDKMTSVERFRSIMSLCRFVLPTASTVEVKGNEGIIPVILNLGSGIKRTEND